MVKRIGSSSELGATLIFDFKKDFLEIMNTGGKTVVTIYEEDKDYLVNETWILKNENYVCENKNVSYKIEDFIKYLDNENCHNIDVLYGEILKLNIFII